MDVAIVAFAQTAAASEDRRNEVEMLQPVIDDVFTQVGLDAQGMGFTCSGSSDYLQGRPFAFVQALNAVGPWPPIAESHVEMDGAWALYEAWTRLQLGDIDTALVYGFGRPSTGELQRVLSLQLDPYTLAPMFPPATALAGLQARAWMEATGADESDLANVVAASRAAAADNPHALFDTAASVEELLAAPLVADPLRAHDVAPVTDGAAAIVLATGDRARELSDAPVWIRGIDHRIEAHQPGLRDLTTSTSTRLAGEGAGVGDAGVDLAELHAQYSHEVPILTAALGLGDEVVVNPSGGALAANAMMAAGLARIGEAATRIAGTDGRAVAHASSGPCLQQNLVTVLEAGA